MAIRGIPESPQFVTESEREVWERLLAQGSDDWTLLANLRLTDPSRDYEMDCVVLMPEVGVVVLEVKGGSVEVRDGQWYQVTGHGDRRIDLVRQARESKYALRRHLEADPRWRETRSSRLRFGHAVVLPYAVFDPDFAVPDCPRWMVHDRGDQAELAGRLYDLAAGQENQYRAPTAADCDLIVEILRGRNLPLRDIVAAADERESHADRLTIEQAALLGATRLLRRVEIRGGAGSGKTVLAVTQVRQLARGGHGQNRQRVALLCYSIGLASLFTRLLQGVERRHRPAFVGTFEELAGYLGVTEFGSRDDPEFWEERLPDQMLARAAELADGRKFDAVVVDEAQDFADLWWTPIMSCLRDPEEGGLFAYSDEHQRVFARFGRPPVPLVPLVLDHNLRNTRQIAQTFAPLAPDRMVARGADGPDVSFVVARPEDALDVADDQIDPLLDQGWRPEDVALLTTGRRHPEQVALQEAVGQAGYWATFWDKDCVFYGHVLGCKGLERRVVVLCINQTAVQEPSRERLYVGLSRATDKLVVVGWPPVVREMGGPEVARRLGL